MRWEVLDKFKSFTEDDSVDISTCIVVGGTPSDPEVVFLNSLSKDINISFLGLERTKENFLFLDLNEFRVGTKTGSLVICSQVLEHVWNHENFFSNLRQLTQVNGHLWLNVPMSNFVHGSPDYFSAGFSPEYLAKNLEQRDFEVIASGFIGKRRYYLATHLLGTWLTKKEHANPIFNCNFQPGTRLGVIRKFIRDWTRRVPLILSSKALSDDLRWGTESYILAKKKC